MSPKIDEFYIARIQYWPERDIETTIVCIYYVWQNGDIDFMPFFENDVIRSTQCAQFELLEKIDMERYK
jgi:hypothetical protein